MATSDTTTATTTADTTTTTMDAEAAATVLSDFAGEVASLRSSCDAAAAPAAEGQGPLAPSSVLGKLKIIRKAVGSLNASPTLKSIQLLSDLAELALLYLPEDTKKVLEDSHCSSEVALELVVRNLTQLPSLAKKLYKVRHDSFDRYPTAGFSLLSSSCRCRSTPLPPLRSVAGLAATARDFAIGKIIN